MKLQAASFWLLALFSIEAAIAANEKWDYLRILTWGRVKHMGS